LYQMYVKDCEKEGKEPQTKAQWLENISA
jgi:hypothetical protein